MEYFQTLKLKEEDTEDKEEETEDAEEDPEDK